MTAEKEKPIEVYRPDGTYLSNCTRKRAAQMVFRNKAQWIGRDKLVLLITNEEEKKIRKRVLERDGYVCYICEKQLAEDEVTYDHIIPRSQGGTDYEDNLAVCCQECNEEKADRNLEQYVLYLYWKILMLLGGYPLCLNQLWKNSYRI